MTIVSYGLGIVGYGNGGQAVPVDTVLITDPVPILNLIDRVTITSGQDVVTVLEDERITLELGAVVTIHIADDDVSVILGDNEFLN